jgi:hypothetical protein
VNVFQVFVHVAFHKPKKTFILSNESMLTEYVHVINQVVYEFQVTTVHRLVNPSVNCKRYQLNQAHVSTLVVRVIVTGFVTKLQLNGDKINGIDGGVLSFTVIIVA